MKNNIYFVLFLTLGLILAGCREPEDLQAPGGEMAFCIGTNGVVGESFTKGVVSGEVNTSVKTLQLICFDPSGYYLGTRTAYPKEDSVDPTKGTFSGYVPESTARIHFVANAVLDLSEFAIGVSEKVIMTSAQLSTQYSDINQSDASAPKLCYWGYHKEDTADEMKTWLQEGLPAKGSGTPNTVSLLRDRARIQLTLGEEIYNGGWVANSAGSGKTITSIKWGITNGRERGYLAPPATSWAGYAGGSVAMHEYEDCNRYVLSETQLDAFDPSSANFQYVFDDSNKKTTSENGRVVLVLEVNYDEGGTPGKKYLLAQLRVGSGANLGEMAQIIRNGTYVVNVTNLSHDGYISFAEAVNPNADDFTNAPADVDVTVPYIMDGMHVLNLISPKPVVVTRTAGQNYTVEFEYTKASAEDETTAGDFVIEWEENINDGWTIGALNDPPTVSGNVSRWTFTVTIGTIGTSYAYSDHLVIRHKKSGLSRYIHFYAVQQFIYQVTPTLTQVMDGAMPYMGPSGDETGRPVFKLSFKLSKSVQEDLFPLTVRITSSTLEPFGDKTTSHTARLSGGFAIENASTAQSLDGTTLVSSSSANDWNYNSDIWGYWYDYTLQEYPKTGGERDGEVVIYLKDIRDAYAQASEQSVGLYLDVANFQSYGLTVPVSYPSYAYQEGLVAGSYRVGNVANKYRLTITGTGAAPGTTYTLSEETDASWLTENPTSITADASGNLVFKFSVSANTAGERSANVIFTNNSDTSLKTKMTIIQESGMEPDFRVKAESTSVMGSTREVKLTVYSDVDWTLNTSAGELFSTVSTVVQDASDQVHGSSSAVGIPVILTMPVNYTLSDILYTVTLSKTADPSDTKTVVITQRKVKEFQEGKTATFTAGTHFESGRTDSSGGIIGVFPSTPSKAGGGLDFTVRWDFADDTPLTLTKEDSVLEMTGFTFKFHETSLSGVWCPYYLHVVDNTTSNYWDLAPGSTTANWLWNPASDPTTGDPLTFTDVTITFVRSTYNIGLVNFTVTYTGVIWE